MVCNVRAMHEARKGAPSTLSLAPAQRVVTTAFGTTDTTPAYSPALEPRPVPELVHNVTTNPYYPFSLSLPIFYSSANGAPHS